MNFDVIENLSDENIYELYEDCILNKSDEKMACYCECNRVGIADYNNGWGCGNHQNISPYCVSECHTGCRNWAVNKRLSGSCDCQCGGNTRYGLPDPICYCT